MMFKAAIQEVGNAIGLKGQFLIDWGTGDIIAAYKSLHDELHPPPEMETVEESAWLRVYPNGYSLNKNEPVQEGGVIRVKLTGTYERPVKPKVKRREVAGTFYTGYDAFRAKGNKGIPDEATLIFEWTEDTP